MIDFLIVGSTKAGTTSLFHALKQHPLIAVPSGNEWVAKEPHFFSRGLFGPNYCGLAREMNTVAEYGYLWRHAPSGLLRGDFDPLTLHGPDAPERVHALNPKAKIIVILRNPIERAYSHYLMDVRECTETRPFIFAIREELKKMESGSQEYCPLVRLGFYCRQIDRFRQAFGSENVRVWLYDELLSAPDRVMGEIGAFLGITPTGFGDISQIRENEIGVPRNRVVASLLRARYHTLRGPRKLYLHLPRWFRRYVRNKLLFKKAPISPISLEARQLLVDIYKEDVTALEHLLKRDLTYWLRDPSNPMSLPESIQKAKQAEFFDEATDDEFEIERPRSCGRLYQWSIESKFNLAIKSLSFSLRGQSLLDLCCGSGMASEYYAAAGANVTGLDISARSVTRAAERAKRHRFAATFTIGDAEELPFGDRSFDVVSVHDGLHHLPNPHKALREMARVARRAIVVIEPARSWLTSQAVAAGLALDYEDAGNYVYRFREDEIFKIAEEADFQSKRYKQFLLYYRHEPFRNAKYFEKTPLFYAVPMIFRVASILAPRLGNKLCVVCER